VEEHALQFLVAETRDRQRLLPRCYQYPPAYDIVAVISTMTTFGEPMGSGAYEKS